MKILIISPHYPPSNLAAVHRGRLFAQHLPALGWQPIVLTVHEKHYEENLDWNLTQLLPSNQRIEKTNAFPVTMPRLIGDLGLRAFFQLRRRTLQLVRDEQIDLVYILIPSFYVALIGPYLWRKTKVPYGIDYIDPWVHVFPGSDKKFSRHWWSTLLAKYLEPIAVKKAALITGVAEGYYQGVLERNPHLQQQAITGAMPYGGEAQDHIAVEQMGLSPYLFQSNDKLQLIYAGAMLPKAYAPLEAIFRAIGQNLAQFANVEFHFIGTGKRANDPQSYNIRPLAEQYGLWQKIVFEYPQRIAYLDVLVHLNAADAVFILGSTEAHYTPSKTYQGVLSNKPILAVLHEESSAVAVVQKTKAGVVLPFKGEEGIEHVEQNFVSCFREFITFQQNFSPSQVDRAAFEAYSAHAVTQQLANLLNRVIPN